MSELAVIRRIPPH